MMKAALRALLTCALIAPLLLVAPGSAAAATSDFRGVNWADARDNYVDGWVIPSGLNAGDSYATVHATSDRVLAGFADLGANTVRLPINEPSVNSDWWPRYRAAVDTATARGMKVILSYWESDKDGVVDDPAGWQAMWDRVVADYGNNSLVHFEMMNEPFGYSLRDWVSLNADWMARHSSVPRGRVIVSGTGYNDDVTGVGAAPELQGTLLSLHFYGFWHDYTTRAEWTRNLSDRLGPYSGRTIIDEAGSPMTTGLRYSGAPQDGNRYTSYLAATTDLVRDRGMGIVYWPGLRDGDSYSMTRRDGDRLVVTNQSGLTQLRWGWGL